MTGEHEGGAAAPKFVWDAELYDGEDYPTIINPGTSPPLSSGSFSNYQLPSTDSTPLLIENWRKLREEHEDDLKTKEWKELEQAYYDHVSWRFTYPQKAFTHQLFSAWAITILVILLTLTGLIFSGFQLRKALITSNLSSLQTEVALDAAGKISISSSIVGGIVLVVSIVFFYLFVRYVYGVKQPIPPHVSILDTDVRRIKKLDKKQN